MVNVAMIMAYIRILWERYPKSKTQYLSYGSSSLYPSCSPTGIPENSNCQTEDEGQGWGGFHSHGNRIAGWFILESPLRMEDD